jgi:hypothetical protein
MGLREVIPYGDKKIVFTIDLDNATYFGESIHLYIHKNEKNEKKKKEKKDNSLGKN